MLALPLPVRSELPPLAGELKRYRGTRIDTGETRELDELNAARARTALWLALGGDASKLRVEPAGPAFARAS